MTYEQWRISYQDSEQAARAAFNAWQSAAYQCGELTDRITCSIARYGDDVSRYGEVLALRQERDQLKSIIDVIDSKIPITPNTFGGSYMIMLEQSDIDLLRQKAQEAPHAT